MGLQADTRQARRWGVACFNWSHRLSLCVVPISCLHDFIFLFGRNTDGVIAHCGPRPVRGVTEAVLIAQLLLNLLVDLLHRLLLGSFKKATARLFGESLQDFLAIRPRWLGISRVSATVPAHSAPTVTATKPSPVSVRLVIGK